MSVEVYGPGSSHGVMGRVYFHGDGAEGGEPRRCTFDYTGHLDGLLRLWCRRYPQLSHIDMDRVVVTVAKCRTKAMRGVYASIASLRYPEGRADTGRQVGGRSFFRWPRIRKNGRDALYLVKMYLPRFHNLSVDEKVSVILHELHHIHPKFNGELRNFGGRRWVHGPSQASFEEMFAGLRRDILKRLGPVCKLFLDCKFHVLRKRFGDVSGDRLVLRPRRRKQEAAADGSSRGGAFGQECARRD